MHRRFWMCWFAALPIATQCAPATVARVEVLASSGTPSSMLREQLKKAEDSFVLVDIGVFVDAMVVSLRHDWQRLETTRARSLSVLLERMCDGFTNGGPAPDVAACQSIARVATALLGAKVEEDALPRDVLDELTEVRAERVGALRFVHGRPAIDWSIARPSGAYVGELDALFRTTVYLRAVLAQASREQVEVWNTAIASQKDTEACRGLDRTDAAVRLLLGTDAATMPGLVGRLDPQQAPDLVKLAALRDDSRDPWSKLDAVFAIAPASPRPTDVRHAVLALANSFATESTEGEFFAALGSERWRRKWTDCASFVYVGMRELDGLGSLTGLETLKLQPRIVVEPAPRSWRALRDFASACEAMCRAFDERGYYRTEEIDVAIEALAKQQRGEDLAPEVEAKLLHWMLWGFDSSGGSSSVEIEGVRGALRRAGPVLVRLPIRWKGETQNALGFRIFVEHEEATGTWAPPPWGVDLGAVPAPEHGKSAAK